MEKKVVNVNSDSVTDYPFVSVYPTAYSYLYREIRGHL